MTQKYDGRQLTRGQRRPITNSTIRRPDRNTISPAYATIIHASRTAPTCARWGCRRAATAAHVTAWRAQERLCARCWRAASLAERVEVVRCQLAELFGASRPRGAISGGRVVTLAVSPALIGAERRAAAWTP